MTGTTDLVTKLRGDGYQVTPTYLQSLINERVIPKPQICMGRRVWTEEEVRELVRILDERGRHSGGSHGR